MNVLHRRRLLPSTGPANLLAAALADGAVAIYTFNETSGVLINRKAPGTNDLSVDAAVTRGVTAVEPSDQKAYEFPATGAPTLYGHAEGTRVDVTGSTAFTCEAVLKVVTDPIISTTLIDLDRNAGSTISDCSFAVANVNLLASVAIQGRAINNQKLTDANSGQHSVYAHYVWQWDGTNFRTWRNAINKVTVAIGGGGEGIQSGSAPYNISFGGGYQFAASNTDCAIDFFALYSTVHLRPDQITTHYRVSGT